MPLNINSAIAAAFSPDGLKAFILGNGGNTLYVYSTLQSLQVAKPNPLPTPATSIVFNSTGSFALLSGGAPTGSLAVYNTCDNSSVTLTPPPTTPPLPSPPLFLKMVPPGNVPMGNTIIPVPLLTDGLDFFFGLDNTGIDIIATNSSLLPLPLPAGQLTLPTLCPRPIVLAQTAMPPTTTFEPIHINIGFGTFHPINFFLSPDISHAYIVTTDFGVLTYSFNTSSVSRIQLANDAAPVAADVSADGSLIYVAGSDGLLHELNTATGLDQNQTSFISLPNSANDFCFTGNNCALNLVAVKP
jgi:WD40 repeat protein